MKIFKEFPKNKPKSILLDKVNFPADLKQLNLSELEVLADELREFLLYSVSLEVILVQDWAPLN